MTYAEKYNDNGTDIEAYKNTIDDAKPVSSETPSTDTIIMVPLKLWPGAGLIGATDSFFMKHFNEEWFLLK